MRSSQNQRLLSRWFVLFIASLLPACADDGSADIAGEVDGIEFEVGYGKAEEPFSGAGRWLVFREYPASCNGAAEVGDSLLFIWLQVVGTEELVEVPAGSYAVNETQAVDGEEVSVAAILQSAGGGNVEYAASGTVTIESSSPSRYVGSFELHWPNDESLRGEFDIPTCLRP